jgi:hypothetical protein
MFTNSYKSLSLFPALLSAALAALRTHGAAAAATEHHFSLDRQEALVGLLSNKAD